MVGVRRRYRHWIDRESARAERLECERPEKVAGEVAETLELAAKARRRGWDAVADALEMCARVQQGEG